MAGRFLLPFGRELLPITARAELVEPRAPVAAASEEDLIKQALENPVGTPKLEELLRPGERVAIVVSDITRRTRSELFLPIILEALNRAGIPDRDAFIVFALGNHRPHTPDEQRAIVGEQVYGRLRLYDHNASDARELVKVGVTRFGNAIEINRRVAEADRIVLTGSIVPHRIAGYSGGRKSLVPGLASLSTIEFNHRMVLDPRCQLCVLDGNPAHEDMLEGCSLVNPDFMLNVILGADGRVLRAVAGHFALAHQQGCQAAAELLGTPLDSPFDMVIASAGGWPFDIDLRQAHKGMEHACLALRPGGILFYYAECSDGLGSPHMHRYLRDYADASGIEQALRERFQVGGHKALWLVQLAKRYRVYLVSRLDEDIVRRCGFRAVPPEQHQRCLEQLIASQGDLRVGIILNACSTLPVPAWRKAGEIVDRGAMLNCDSHCHLEA